MNLSSHTNSYKYLISFKETEIHIQTNKITNGKRQHKVCKRWRTTRLWLRCQVTLKAVFRKPLVYLFLFSMRDTTGPNQLTSIQPKERKEVKVWAHLVCNAKIKQNGGFGFVFFFINKEEKCIRLLSWNSHNPVPLLFQTKPSICHKCIAWTETHGNSRIWIYSLLESREQMINRWAEPFSHPTIQTIPVANTEVLFIKNLFAVGSFCLEGNQQNQTSNS